MKKLFSLIILVYIFSDGGAQPANWWEEKHNWDGVSSWMKYITYSPSYMGPNALPVPDVSKGMFEENFYLGLGSVYHHSKGDQTFNFLSEFNLPVASGKAVILISYMPVEFYETDTLTRDIRAGIDYETDGYSLGDFYLSTYLQLVKDHDKLPDMMLTINLKTASGTNLRNARNTDAPGYWFDFSAGKKISISNKRIEYLRPYGMAGFYVYQTNCFKYTQNDAFLFGAGAEIGFEKFRLDTEVGGYLGYFDLGDQPVVYRLEYRSLREGVMDYRIFFQTGIQDFPFTSFGFSTLINYKKPDWLGGRVVE